METFRSYIVGERIHVSDGGENRICMAAGQDGQLLVLKRVTAVGDLGPRVLAATEVLRGLSHPNICQVTDLGTEGEAAFLVRHYAEGKDLRAVIRRVVLQQKSIEELTALYIAGEACAAIEHLHENVHEVNVRCQVTPRQIILGYSGTVQISEPLVPGDGLEIEADLLALGACLHEMMVGAQVQPELSRLARPIQAMIEPALQARSVTMLHAKIEERLAGRATQEDVAALLGRVFPKARQTEEQWRRQLTAAQQLGVPSASSPSFAPDGSAPSSELAPFAPEAAFTPPPTQSPFTPSPSAFTPAPAMAYTAAPSAHAAPATHGSSRVVAWAFAALALVSAVFLAYWGATILQKPKSRISVISDAPVEAHLPTTGSCRSPCSLEVDPGAYKLRITFLESGKVLMRDVRVGDSQHLELRLRVREKR
jgi:hypothetical protein